MSWYKNHPGKQAAALRLHRYKLTHTAYEALKKKQKGLCAICGKPRRLSVDHCHKGGKVRGLLCNNCNTGIGLLGENLEILRAAMCYIRKHA